MAKLFLGIDVSKGYANFECINESGSSLINNQQFDDTPEGHKAVLELLNQALVKVDTDIIVGVESSGGLERNWLHFFRELGKSFPVKCYLLNPLAVKKFLERELHRNITDGISARGIALYLKQGMRPSDLPFDPKMEGEISMYRCLRNAIYRLGQVKNELQSLLPRVQPQLIQFCRKGFPDWVVSLLNKFPTVEDLIKVSPEALAEIPYITTKRATNLIEDARKSVAAQRDPGTGMTIKFLCGELIHGEKAIQEMKGILCEKLKDDDGVKIMQSVPGIGIWTAVCLRLELGEIDRFSSPKALVAYAGLDPRIHQSGDSERNKGISRRGKSQIRAILYPPVFVGIRHNPVIKIFYARLRSEGKCHLKSATACMRKLLHLVYACWITGKEFDSKYEEKLLQRTAAAKNAKAIKEAKISVETQPPSLKAPISHREAKRRKASTVPQTGITRQLRGPSVASESQNNSTRPGGQQ